MVRLVNSLFKEFVFSRLTIKIIKKCHDNRSFAPSTSPQDIRTFLGLDYGSFNEGYTRVAVFDSAFALGSSCADCTRLISTST